MSKVKHISFYRQIKISGIYGHQKKNTFYDWTENFD